MTFLEDLIMHNELDFEDIEEYLKSIGKKVVDENYTCPNCNSDSFPMSDNPKNKPNEKS